MPLAKRPKLVSEDRTRLERYWHPRRGNSFPPQCFFQCPLQVGIPLLGRYPFTTRFDGQHLGLARFRVRVRVRVRVRALHPAAMRHPFALRARSHFSALEMPNPSSAPSTR